MFIRVLAKAKTPTPPSQQQKSPCYQAPAKAIGIIRTNRNRERPDPARWLTAASRHEDEAGLHTEAPLRRHDICIIFIPRTNLQKVSRMDQPHHGAIRVAVGNFSCSIDTFKQGHRRET